jgi:hypothetical protein
LKNKEKFSLKDFESKYGKINVDLEGEIEELSDEDDGNDEGE